jgi:iron(III) transport system substrate-binding protein
MMRTAFVSDSAPNREAATAFVAHLLAVQAPGAAREGLPLPPLASAQDYSGQATISLGPALMTYLDAQKRRLFLREWENAMIQPQ